MKHVILLAIFLMLFNSPNCLLAQDVVSKKKNTYVGIAPQGLLNKFRLSIEEDITSRSVIGTLLSYHYGPFSQYKGPSIFGYYKYSIGKEKASGKARTTYLIVRAGVAYTKTPYYHVTQSGLGGSTKYGYKDGENSLGYGKGGGIGKKWQYNNWFIDLNIIFQAWGMTNTDELYYQYPDHSERFTFDYTYSHLSPGFIVSPTFIWGYVIK